MEGHRGPGRYGVDPNLDAEIEALERRIEALKALDHVAYVRFASVYRSFQDLDEFRAEIDRLSANPIPNKPETGGQ